MLQEIIKKVDLTLGALFSGDYDINLLLRDHWRYAAENKTFPSYYIVDKAPPTLTWQTFMFHSDPKPHHWFLFNDMELNAEQFCISTFCHYFDDWPKWKGYTVKYHTEEDYNTNCHKCGNHSIVCLCIFDKLESIAL